MAHKPVNAYGMAQERDAESLTKRMFKAGKLRPGSVSNAKRLSPPTKSTGLGPHR